MPTNFALVVPRNTTKPVSRVTLILSLSDEADMNAVTFTITDPEGSAHTFAALSAPIPTNPSATDSFNYPQPPGIPRQDRVVIERPAALMGDPRRKTCSITLTLNTNIDANASCVSTMPTPTEQWQITIAGAEFSGICPNSLTRNSGGGCIGASAYDRILSNNPAEVATVDGQANFQCSLERSAADIVVVLDRSGSMSSMSASSDPGLPMMATRMDALHKAIKDFTQVWSSLLAPGDRIGVVMFDDVVETPVWDGTDFGTLQPFDTQGSKVKDNIDTLNARNMTSIGGGLQRGDTVLGAGTNRRILLVMSDGQQNTDPKVAVDLITNTVNTTGVGSASLVNLITNPYPIYTVTIGPSAQVDAAIMDNMAKATGGFYLHSEENYKLLSPFFLELLSNFVRFNSWETARLVHASVGFKTPYVMSQPLSTITQKLGIHLSWPVATAALRLRVEPPVVTSPPTVFETSGFSGSLLLSINPAGLLDPVRDWIITVEEIGDTDIGINKAFAARTTDNIPFDLIVLADDFAVKSEFLIEPEDYKPGNLIKLQVRLSTFGEPENLGNIGDRVVAHVVRPGQSVGDLLSDSTASAQSPQNNDAMTAAQAKLYNELLNNPNGLRRNTNNPDLVTLRHTGPGIYTGVFEARLAGHYNFLFTVEGLSEGAGRFSRQELRTVYVREVPAANQTAVQTIVSRTSEGGFITLSFTPRTVFGNRMGPGWGNYFWFTAPGLAPFKAHDNLDGSYTATAGFTGLFLPTVSLHFLDVLSIIDDSTTSDNLPVPLTPDNALISDVNPLTSRLSWGLLLLLVFLFGVTVGLLI